MSLGNSLCFNLAFKRVELVDFQLYLVIGGTDTGKFCLASRTAKETEGDALARPSVLEEAQQTISVEDMGTVGERHA